MVSTAQSLALAIECALLDFQLAFDLLASVAVVAVGLFVLDDTGRLLPVAAADQRDGPGRYGLDAARIPARLPVCSGGREVAARLWLRLQALDGQGAALAYSLDGRPLADQEHAVGLVGAAGAAEAAGDRVAAGRLLARAGELEREHPTYTAPRGWR